MDTAVISEPTTVADRPAQDAAPVQVPSVGRIVHVENVHGECLAAIVTRVDEDHLWVTVFRPDLLPETRALLPDEWHWPERT